jgi:RNA 3'-terminal phosphate cyclase (ATP)
MFEIDGSRWSGSGTIVRYAAAIAALLGESLQMTGIRAKRPKPGLRAQHVTAVRSCAALSGGSVEGDTVGSGTIRFVPGPSIIPGDLNVDVGTAGSTVMLGLTLLVPALFAGGASRFTLKGGLFQDFAPTAFHFQRVLLPVLAKMGVRAACNIARPGYVPTGGGKLQLEVQPLTEPLQPLIMKDRGTVTGLRGIALSSHLKEQQVTRRLAMRLAQNMAAKGKEIDIREIDDMTAAQKGAALLAWAETSTGCLIGADMAGKPGRRSEDIADVVADRLTEDMESGATTDRFLADQLILFCALADGISEYMVPSVTDHVETNLRLVEMMLGAKTSINGNTIRIEGTGRKP